MDDRPLRVLLVEDDEDDYLLTRDLLAEVGGDRFHLEWEADYEAALEAMGACRHDVYLVDYRLGGRDGLELLREALARGCTAPLILLTGQGDREVDIEAMQAGATDYLVKGTIDAERLERSIRYALERKRTEEDLRRARAELELRVAERTAELARANEELRRRVDELKEAQEAAEAASRAKDTFLAVVSHELRTPLTPALFAAGAMLARTDLDPEVRDLLRMMEENLQAEARLIDDLLDVTRMVRGKMAYRLEVVDVHDLIERALRACGPQFTDKRLAIATDLGASRPRVRGDAARLQQVLCNLLKNAIKFTPPGGSVTITTRDEGSNLVVGVRDTGIGIEPGDPAEDLPRLRAGRGDHHPSVRRPGAGPGHQPGDRRGPRGPAGGAERGDGPGRPNSS